MDGKIEQRVCIKFCVKLSNPTTKTPVLLNVAFGEHSLSRTVVFQWHSCLKAGQVSVEDDEHSGRPSISKTTENVEEIRDLIHEDHHRIIRELTLWSLPGDFNRTCTTLPQSFVPHSWQMIKSSGM
jgi:hypothetical protein